MVENIVKNIPENKAIAVQLPAHNKKPVSREGNIALDIKRPLFESGLKV